MTELINFLAGIQLAYAQSGSVTDKVASDTQNQITAMVTFIFQQIPLWITSFIVIVMSFVVARLVKAAVENKMSAEGFEEEHKEIQIVAGRTANALVLIVGITIGLKIGGLDLTPIIAAGAFGMGFALQDLITNFIAGVMILSARHYTIGDVVKIGGSTTGKIVEIQTRATILKAFDGTKIVVPNADLFKNQVISYTSNPYRRIQLVNGVAYGSDLKKVMSIIIDVVKSTEGVIDKPKPAVWLSEWGDYSINFKINAWIETKSGVLKVKNRLMVNITEALDRAGINIPYPIQTIQIDKSDDGDLERMITDDEAKKTVSVLPGVPKKLVYDASFMGQPKVESAPVSVPAAPEMTAGLVASTAPIAPPSITDTGTPDWLKKAADRANAEIDAAMHAKNMVSEITTSAPVLIAQGSQVSQAISIPPQDSTTPQPISMPQDSSVILQPGNNPDMVYQGEQAPLQAQYQPPAINQ